MLIEKILTYDYSKIADWMIKTGVVFVKVNEKVSQALMNF